MGEDYAKLAGLTAEEDLKETTLQSMKRECHGLSSCFFGNDSVFRSRNI